MIDFSDSDQFEQNAEQIVQNSQKIMNILRQANLYDIFQIAIQSSTSENNHPLERYLQKAIQEQMQNRQYEPILQTNDISEIVRSSIDTNRQQSPKEESICQHSLCEEDQTVILPHESPIKELQKKEVEEMTFNQRESQQTVTFCQQDLKDTNQMVQQNLLEESFKEYLSQVSSSSQRNVKKLNEEKVGMLDEVSKEMMLTECIQYLFGLQQKQDMEEKNENNQKLAGVSQESKLIIHSSQSSKLSQALVSARDNYEKNSPLQPLFESRSQETGDGSTQKEEGSYQSVTQIPNNSNQVLSQLQNKMGSRNQRQTVGKNYQSHKNLTPQGKTNENRSKDIKKPKKQQYDALKPVRQNLELENHDWVSKAVCAKTGSECLQIDIQTPQAKTFQNIKSVKNKYKNVDARSSMTSDLSPLILAKQSQLSSKRLLTGEMNVPQTSRVSNEEKLEAIQSTLESKKNKMIISFSEFNLNVIFEVLKPKASSKSTFQAGKMISILVNSFREKPLLGEEFQHWSKIQAFISFNLGKFTQEVHSLKLKTLEMGGEQFEDRKFIEQIKKINSEFFRDSKVALFKAVQSNKQIKIIVNLVFCTVQFILSRYKEHMILKMMKGKGEASKGENQKHSLNPKRSTSRSCSKTIEPYVSRKFQKEALFLQTSSNLPIDKLVLPSSKAVSAFTPIDLKCQEFRSTTPLNNRKQFGQGVSPFSKVFNMGARKDESLSSKEKALTQSIQEVSIGKTTKSQSRNDPMRESRTVKKPSFNVSELSALDQMKANMNVKKERSKSPNFASISSCRESLGGNKQNQLANYKSLISHRAPPELTSNPQRQVTQEKNESMGDSSKLQERMNDIFHEVRSKSQLAKDSRFRRIEQEILANQVTPTSGKVDLGLIEQLKMKRQEQRK